MGGVYLIEITPREITDYKFLKIGSTSKSLEYRANQYFDKEFNSKENNYYIIDIIHANRSVAVNLENFLINEAIAYFGKPVRGRELFKVDREEKLEYFKSSIDSLVIEFYRINNMHSLRESSLGSIIRAKRKKMGYTQDYLAEASGLRQATISDIENGKIGRYATIKKVMMQLDIGILVK